MKKEERKLTPAEQKRREQFQTICEEMEQNGYEKQDLTIGVLQANIIALVITLPFVVFFVWLYLIVNPQGSFVMINPSYLWLFVGMLFLLIIAHEGIHGLTWAIFAKKHLHSISFGVIWKYLTPYCTCDEPLRKGQYIIGGAMPTLILGFGMAVIAIFATIPSLWCLSLLMILSGGGDFFIILKIALHKSAGKDVVYYDHPYECGAVAFVRDN